MGHAASAWARIAVPASNPFGRFEEGLQIPLDAVVADHRCAPLRSFFDGLDTMAADPFTADDWAFAAERFLESGRAAPGARIATSDPHATELGVFSIAAFHHTPAPLLSSARERHEALQHPRQTLVLVNDGLASSLDAADIALHLLREVGPAGFTNAVLEFAGDGFARLDIAARRRLLGAVSLTGCLTALGPFDGEAAEAWNRTRPSSAPPLEPVPSEKRPEHDELVIVNGERIEPLVFVPARATTMAASAFPPRPIHRVLIGGCIGGDLDSLQLSLQRLEREPPWPAVEVALVAASRGLHGEAVELGFTERAAQVGAALLPPAQLPPARGLTLTTSPCLDPSALVAGLSTCVASARAGRIRAPEVSP